MKITGSIYPAIFSLIISAVCLLSCGQGNDSKASTGDSLAQPVAYDQSLPIGVVKDTVVCKQNTDQSYALYLPSHYKSDKPSPCIIFFDAHARGALPLRMYKDIAEKYGFVLIGSNTSKNRLSKDVVDAIVNTLWDDVHRRINIDTGRTYTSGFSGGSQVAFFAAVTHSNVAGVIACAGGAVNMQKDLLRGFSYFGIGGNYDFNLPEMMRLDLVFENAKKPHQLLTWQGIHALAPAAEYKTAVLWMMVSGMKLRKLAHDDKIIAELKSDYDKRIAAAHSQGDWLYEGSLLYGAVNVLDGLTDITGYSKQLKSLEASPGCKKASGLLPGILNGELSQEQQLGAQFTTQDEQWWTKKIAELNREISAAKTTDGANSAHRVLAFIGLTGYTNVAHAIAADDIEHAGTYLRIFRMADPKNPDCGYFAALIDMKKGDAKAAIDALKDAVALGYSDVSQLLREPAFASLHNDPAFATIVNKVGDNHSGKNLMN